MVEWGSTTSSCNTQDAYKIPAHLQQPPRDRDLSTRHVKIKIVHYRVLQNIVVIMWKLGVTQLSWPAQSMEVEALEIGLSRVQCYWELKQAKSFERIHRSNLVGMGIIPLGFKAGEDGLTGHERFSIDLPSKVSEIIPGQDVTVVTDTGKSFTCTTRFDTGFDAGLRRLMNQKF